MFGYAAFLLWSALSSEPDDYGCVFKRHGGQDEVVKVRLLQPGQRHDNQEGSALLTTLLFQLRVSRYLVILSHLTFVPVIEYRPAGISQGSTGRIAAKTFDAWTFSCRLLPLS